MMDNIFLPDVPTDQRKLLTMSDAYRFAVQVVSNTTDLFVEKVFVSFATGERKPTVIFSTAKRVKVMRLSYADPKWIAETRQSVDAMAWAFLAESERLTYLAKAMTNSRTKARQSLINSIGGLIFDKAERNAVLTCVRNAHHKLINSRRLTMNYREMLNSDSIGTLLKVFFNEVSPLEISAEHRQAFETVRTEREKRKDTRSEIKKLMTELFEHPKWLISYVPGDGYRVSGVDVACTWENIINSEHATRDHSKMYGTTHPLQFYKTLEDLPEDIKDSLMGRLTLNKMHVKNQHPQLMYAVEPHDLIPQILHDPNIIVSEAMSSVMLRMTDATVIMVNQ